MQNKSTNFELKIFSDGGSRGNPGPAAFGYSVRENNIVIHCENGCIGTATNNVAEYTGVLKAMEWLVKQNRNKSKVIFHLDSLLATKQLQGEYKVKNKELKEFHKKIKDLEKKTNSGIEYKYIPREKNKEADALVNKALDSL